METWENLTLSPGSANRLRRIMKLRNCTEAEAISFALVCGWATAEKVHAEKEKRANGGEQ